MAVALAGVAAASARAECPDEQILSLVRPWRFDQNGGHVSDGVPASAEAAIFRTTEAWRQMFVRAYPEAHGGLLRGIGTISGTSQFSLPGLIPYQYEADFYPFWCDPTRNNELVSNPGYMTVNSAQVAANDLRYVIEDLAGDFALNGQPITLYRLAHVKGTLAGLTVYEPFAYDGSSAIMVTHGGKQPFRPISQREYLEAVKFHWEKTIADASDDRSEMEQQIRAQMEEVKKELTGDMLAQVLKGLNDALAQLGPVDAKRSAAIAQVREEEIAPIDDYLATTPEAVLRQTAIPVALGSHRGFTTEKDGGHQIVVLDESYRNKALPPQAAQVIVMYWYNDPEYAGSRSFRQSIENGFPFGELRPMLDR
jgi:hypothetical protein